jgi:hypothetical protein
VRGHGATTRWRVGLAVLALLAGSCHQALLTAPPGSTVTLVANPQFIPAHGGVSVITAVVVEPAGTPVPDGTVVQFFTNLGSIDEQGRSNDGVVRVNLIADARSGTATVTAVSGGPAIAPSPSPSPSPSPTPTPAPRTDAGLMAASNMNSATVDVVIGSALPASMLVTATPTRLTEKRASLITANVFDASGNPVAHVPIIFTVDGVTERMDSQGSPTFTDNNGQAQDVMRTRYDVAEPSKTVTVKAQTPTAIAGEVKVTIN